MLVKGTTQLLFTGMGRLSENCVLNIKNKSHSVTAEIEVPEVGRRRCDHRSGREHRRLEPVCEGWQAQYCYNLAGVHHFFVEAAEAMPAGQHQIRMEFAYAGGGLGKGGGVALYVDGKKVGEVTFQ